MREPCLDGDEQTCAVLLCLACPGVLKHLGRLRRSTSIRLRSPLKVRRNSRTQHMPTDAPVLRHSTS